MGNLFQHLQVNQNMHYESIQNNQVKIQYCMCVCEREGGGGELLHG